MALPTQPYKGARDFYPEDKRLQKYLFGKLREVVERYGYEEYDAPILESVDLYLAKSGEEIVNEQTYSFQDRGGRQVVIRPEMTPTVSRMVAARRQELGYPLRWYSIPNLWRYERPQKGRLREHWQLNVDLFGVEGNAAEREIIHVTDSIMRSFGADHSMYKIRLNDRRFVNYLLHEYIGFDDVQSNSISKLIDRMHKMEAAEFQTKLDALCTPSQRDNGAVERLLAILTVDMLENLPPELVEHESLAAIKTLLGNLLDENIANVVFDPTLMRGFDYYSGIVFEVFDVSPDNNRSLFGGGRYDGLVGLFGVEPVPTVGFGMGDVVLADFLETHNLLPKLAPETQLYAAVVDEALLPDAEKVVSQLRREGIKVALDISGKSLDKQLKTAHKKSIPFVLVIGRKELDEGQFVLKSMLSGSEERHGLDRIASLVADARQSDLERE